MKLRKIKYDESAEYWTANNLLSYSRPISIAMSIRNLGKTYSMVKIVKKCVSEGNNCAWSRWDDEELNTAINDIFPLEEVYTKDNPSGEWGKTVINKSCVFFTHIKSGGKLYFFSIKMAHKHKGTDIPNFVWWVYDEFIPEFYENETRRVTEFAKWQSMYVTLKRNNQNFKAVLLSNCLSWFNGYFDGWGIVPFPSGNIGLFEQSARININNKVETIKSEVVMENVKPTERQIQRIILDEVIRGNSDIEGYLNNMTRDNQTLIEQCPNMNIPLYNAEWYFIKRCYSFREYGGLLYWIEVQPRNVNKWTTNKDDITNEIYRDRGIGKVLEEYYDKGKMRFADGNVENAILGMINASRQFKMRL